MDQIKYNNTPDRLVVPMCSGERSASTSYSVAAPTCTLWNSLPANNKNSTSLAGADLL